MITLDNGSRSNNTPQATTGTGSDNCVWNPRRRYFFSLFLFFLTVTLLVRKCQSKFFFVFRVRVSYIVHHAPMHCWFMHHDGQRATARHKRDRRADTSYCFHRVVTTFVITVLFFSLLSTLRGHIGHQAESADFWLFFGYASPKLIFDFLYQKTQRPPPFFGAFLNGSEHLFPDTEVIGVLVTNQISYWLVQFSSCGNYIRHHGSLFFLSLRSLRKVRIHVYLKTAPGSSILSASWEGYTVTTTRPWRSQTNFIICPSRIPY